MRRPSDRWDRYAGNRYCTPIRVYVFFESLRPTPEQYRNTAAWLRKVADWYEHLAKKNERKVK